MWITFIYRIMSIRPIISYCFNVWHDPSVKVQSASSIKGSSLKTYAHQSSATDAWRDGGMGVGGGGASWSIWATDVRRVKLKWGALVFQQAHNYSHLLTALNRLPELLCRTYENDSIWLWKTTKANLSAWATFRKIRKYNHTCTPTLATKYFA